MKKILLSLIIIAPAYLFAQQIEADQNPNYQQSLDNYTEKAQLRAGQGTTIQQTYTPVDELAERKDQRLQ